MDEKERKRNKVSGIHEKICIELVRCDCLMCFKSKIGGEVSEAHDYN